MVSVGAGGAFGGCHTTPTVSQARDRRRNFVLVMSDEHNPSYSSVYGRSDIHTPNLQRLADRGTVFEYAYCPSPLCMPCRSAFMTGKRVHEIQTYNNCNVFGFDYPNYGSVLRKQGVATAYIGKTDVYRPGSELGFSEMILPGDRTAPGDTNFSRTPLNIREDAAERAGAFGPVNSRPFKGDDAKVEAAVKWLTERAKGSAAPWVLVLNLVKPHFPHYVTPELWDLYPNGADLPRYGRDCTSANHPYALDLRAHFQTDQFTEEQIRGLRRGYLGCVTYVDRQVGKILDALEAGGFLNDTVVAYTSDHGDMLGKFGMWWKCSLYEESVRVPLIVAGPGFKSGTRVGTPVDLHDLQATMFATVGARRPRDWVGAALQEMPPHSPGRVVFAEYHGHGTRSGAFMVRKGPWKLLYYMAAPHQLFNLEEDPEELNNVMARHPRVFRELEAELRGICSPEDENRRAHEFERRQLEALASLEPRKVSDE
ncbi:MAG: sulfatase-like hydrolase/transferase [Candidatus Hydrogenedentes bacterium]|nr:sulfatase-like hydrolase/transferase [Candidatus Hydrogenedentota bacterium]